jgi:hypothetical protein
MAIGYTGLSGANVELTTVAVALSFVIAVFTVPFWMTLFASQYSVPVPIQEMMTTILTVLIAPMILGFITRRILVRRLGEKKIHAIPTLLSLHLIAVHVWDYFPDFLRQGGNDHEQVAGGVDHIGAERAIRIVESGAANLVESAAEVELSRPHGSGVFQFQFEQQHRDCHRDDSIHPPGGGACRDDAHHPNSFDGELSEIGTAGARLL